MSVQVDTYKSTLNTSNNQIPIIDIGDLLDGKKEASNSKTTWHFGSRQTVSKLRNLGSMIVSILNWI